MNDRDEILDLLEFAKDCSIMAGNFLKEEFGKNVKVLTQSNRDIKLEIDQISEKLINDFLSEKTNIPVFGEEFGTKEKITNKYWIVDPLDGSFNFYRKIPICACSVALVYEFQPIIGVINNFLEDKIYYAAQGCGAYCNLDAISVSSINNKRNGSLITGIPSKDSYSDKEFSELIDNFQEWKKIRMLGSAAIANTLVATGSAEVYKESGIFFWDVAAGSIIIKEAGGSAIITEMNDEFRVNAEFTNGNF
jgi:myo-inositol-1(or 4)-monophosphatase